VDAWNEHARLIQAIADGHAGRAEEIMRRHTERTTAFRGRRHLRATEAGRPSAPA
jgi:DNA-binding GntR family transcriptional regulator